MDWSYFMDDLHKARRTAKPAGMIIHGEVIMFDEVSPMTERMWAQLIEGYWDVEVLWVCTCGNRELYFPNRPPPDCSAGCGRRMVQMEPFPSDRLLPKPAS